MATTYIKLGPIGDIFTSDILGIYLTPGNSAEIDEQLIDTRLKSFIQTGFLVIISKVEHDNLRLKVQNARNIPLQVIPIEKTTSVEPVISVTRIPPSNIFAGNRFLVWENPEGPWSGKEDYIAEFTGSGWLFTKPYNGLSVPVYEWGISVKYSGTYPSGYWSYDEETIAKLDLTLVENLKDEAYALELFTKEAKERIEADLALQEIINNFIKNYTTSVKASAVQLDNTERYYGSNNAEGAFKEIGAALKAIGLDLTQIEQAINNFQNTLNIGSIPGGSIIVDTSVPGRITLGIDYVSAKTAMFPIQTTAGTNTKITYDEYGTVLSGTAAVPQDIEGLLDPVSGQIADNWMPKLAITETFVRNSQAGMLALTAETGDVCIRTDINTSYILQGSDPTILGSWQEILSPTTGVQSVTLAMPTADFTITNPTVTNIGTITVAWANQSQNKVLASPASTTGIPSFRALVAGDIPAIDWTKITSGKPTTLSGYGITDAMSLATADARYAFLGGSNASGTWGINITGSAGSVAWTNVSGRPTALSQFTNDLPNSSGYLIGDGASYAGFVANNANDPYMRHVSTNAVIQLARSNGANASGTWGINITGASANSTSWNNQGYLGTGLTGGLTWLMGYDSNVALWKPTGPDVIRAWMSLTSMATKNEAEIHRYGGFGVDANSMAEHTSSFTYANNAPYNGPISYFGANNYGFQLNGSYSVGGVNLAFRTRNGDAGAWNGWGRLWSNFDFVPDTEPSNNTVVQRNNAGYIKATYFYMNGPAVDGGTITDIVTTQNDGYLRRNSASTIRTWLGNYGNWITFAQGDGRYPTKDGVDAIGFAANALDYPYFRHQSSGQIIRLLRHDQVGASAFTAETLNSVTARNPNLYSNVFFQGGSSVSFTNDANSFGSIINQRGDTLYKYTLRASDNTPVGWKENWYDGTTYHTWSTDSKGFVANSKLTAISGEDGSVTYQGALEVRGVNPGITFHYPANYAASLYMNGARALVWHGTDIQTGAFQASNFVSATNYVTTGRVIAGYDSGVPGSINCNAWFRSSGANGWVNATYQGGIYMEDYTWVRVYNGKAFLVDSTVQAYYFRAVNDGFASSTFHGMRGDYLQNGGTDKIIWTIGDSWNTLGTHYGLGYSYSNNLYGAAHQIVGRHNGTTAFSLNLSSGGACFTGYLTAAGGAGTSDMRLKKEVDLNLDLSWLDEDRAFAFKWKSSNMKQIRYGYSAQEINKWAPDLVLKDNPNSWALNQTDLLILEVKRLKQRISEADDKIKKLEAKA